MAWEYADWEEQTTLSEQRSRLVQHRTELRNAITRGYSSDGESVNSSDVTKALEMSTADLAALDARIAAASGAGRPRLVGVRRRVRT
jgi:hypothetical protein